MIYTDNAIIQIFLPLINAGLIAYGYTGVTVAKNFQPTMQGALKTPTVYFFKVSDKRYGFLGRTSGWDEDLMVENRIETQYREMTWQFSAFVTVDFADVNSYTASDLVNTVAQIVQSDSFRLAMQAQGIGIYRVQEIRNPYFVDDRDRYEAFPSFDLTMVFEDIYVTTDNIITPPIVGTDYPI